MNGLINWFARNGVVANLLMVLIVMAGVLTIPDLKKEVFPEFSVNVVSVSVSYRGAAPEEVEEAVCIRVEESLQGLEGIERIRSSANEGMGTVRIEIEPGYDTRALLDDIKARVDAIDTFPEETEKPVIEEAAIRNQVINLSISGDADELTLKRLGEQVRDELLLLPELSQVELKNSRLYEISIEVSEDDLRRHGLTFDQVARAVRRTSLDLPGGSVKAESGEILLRTKGQAYRGEEYEKLTLFTRPDGSRLQLGDVARVVDGFEDSDKFAWLNGKPAVMVQSYRVGDESALEVSRAVKEYAAEAQSRMPEGIVLTPWADAAQILESRMNLLIKNGLTGLLLVFVVLTLFLRLRLALWVTIGIPISFLGAIALMPVFDVSINMVSLFSFIMVLGIVVDDAIVVGESVYSRQQATGRGLSAAIEGTQRVTVPVVFGVLTTAMAFTPMLFVAGDSGPIWQVIPLIVIPTLMFSLIESKLVLPYHLSHYRPRREGQSKSFLARVWDGFFGFFGKALDRFIHRVYRPMFLIVLEWRYLTLAVAVMTLLLTAGLVGGGLVDFNYFPQVESDTVVVDLTMPQETSAAVTARAIRTIEQSAFQLDQEIKQQTGRSLFRHVLTTVGEQPYRTQTERSNRSGDANRYSTPYRAEIIIELVPSEMRSLSSTQIGNRWRELTGPVPGAVELVFASELITSGKAINIQFSSADMVKLREAVSKTKEELARYQGVIDISDSFRGGKPELKLDITPKAEALGLSLQDMGRQVRQGFFGEEAQRIQRGRDDVRVMVRYPAEERRSLGALERMRIRTPDGSEVPFSTVATAQMGRGFATISRVDRQRTINVTADVDEAVTNANRVLGEIEAGFLPDLLSSTPGVAYSLEGEQRDQQETLAGLAQGFSLVVLGIFAMMAIPFRSYLQPLIVLSAVPFGIVGAVWGHVILGYSTSVLSMLGVVALTGIVVNDSLVLVSFINDHRKQGMPLVQAVHRAGIVRFRPILLTSLTTAAGITPLILEKSVQAQFLIPMAISLAFGVLFATFITLGLVPSLYLILEDIKQVFRWFLGIKSLPRIREGRERKKSYPRRATKDYEGPLRGWRRVKRDPPRVGKGQIRVIREGTIGVGKSSKGGHEGPRGETRRGTKTLPACTTNHSPSRRE